MKRTTSQRANGVSRSLGEARLLRSARRTSWERELVAFQIDELNGLFDPLQGPPRKGTIRQTRLREARARIASILQAATWAPDAYFRHAWAIATGTMPAPEDVFGPALLLLELKPDAAPVRAWLASLPANVLMTLRNLGFDCPRLSRAPRLAQPSRWKRPAKVVPLAGR